MNALDRLKRSISKNPETGCWDWIGPTKDRPPNNYGRFFISKARKGYVAAHRLVFSLKYGAIPDGLFACHKCDNPLCVNPDHIFLGTHLDNLKDMREKGRSTIGKPRPYNRGHRNGNCPLTESQVRSIRAMSHYGIKNCSISRIIGCGQSTVGRIVRGETH